jgi:putative ABC transport system permease protein
VKAIADASAAVATDTTDAMGLETTTAITVTTTGTYVFATPEDYEAFDAELRASGLDESYQLTSYDLANYEASLVPLQNLASFATTLLWIVLGVGAVILVVITVFNIRERKYEVGVLTAIGIDKPKVALQFVAEMLIVSFVALVVGLGAGAAASVPVADKLLADQVAQQEATATTTEEAFGRGGLDGGPVTVQGEGGMTWSMGGGANVTYIDQINATVDFAVIGQLAAIGLGLVVIASAAGVISALRYDPLTILANRA